MHVPAARRPRLALRAFPPAGRPAAPVCSLAWALGSPGAPCAAQEWKDLPAPYNRFGVKVDPKHVEDKGVLWKAMYDWKLAIPAALLVAMPLWMTGNLPGFDERLELSLITLLAGTVISKEVAPMFKNMKKTALETRAKCVPPSAGAAGRQPCGPRSEQPP